MSTFFQASFNGLSNSAFYAVLALGITMVFGLTGIVNFAQGQLLMLGALITYSAVQDGVNFYLAIIIALVAVGLLNLALERSLFRFTIKKPLIGIIVSIGMLPVFEAVAVRIWGTGIHSVFPPLKGTFKVQGVFVLQQRLFVVVLSAILLACFFALVRYSHAGRALRASSEDREMSELLGVDVRSIVMMAFVLGGALAGFGGALLVSLLPVDVFVGQSFIFKAFAICLIGGLGNISGVVLGSVIIGLAEAWFGLYLHTASTDTFVYLLMVLILIARPLGLIRGSAGSSTIQ